MNKIIRLCKEVPMLPIVIVAAIPLALIPSWRPWGHWAWSFDPGVGQWIIILLTCWTIIESVKGMIEDLKAGHLGVDLLAVVALASTVCVEQYWATWAVLLMVASGDAIESYAQAKARSSLTALIKAAPQQAHLVNLPGVDGVEGHDGSLTADVAALEEDAEHFRHVSGKIDGHPGASVPVVGAGTAGTDEQSDEEAAHHFTTVPVDQVQLGDVMVVLPGETVPVDGQLISGAATLDLSNINGEPVPRTVYAGAEVLSGSINGSTTMTIRATRLAKDSQYQNILELVRSAQESRSAAVKTADMLAVPFTVVSFLIAALAWIVSGSALRFAQVLVLATPCPLLIAAPVAYVAGTGRLAKHGILVKAQDVLENLGKVTHVFFDKTGTLTVKQPQVVRIEQTAAAPTAATHGLTNDELLVMAGVVENYSVHILAKGIAKAGKDAMVRLGRLTERPVPANPKRAHPRIPDANYPSVADICEEAGKGVSGTVDGRKVRVGRLPFVLESDESSETLKARYAWPSQLAPDEMATYVAIDGQLAARIVLRDVPRADAARSIEKLRQLGVQEVTMLTGDKRASAEEIGSEVGISDVRYELLPDGKVAAVRDAGDHGEHGRRSKQPWWDKVCEKVLGESMTREITMMVGDGVNDAPVLAVADIGVAITDGTSTAASESAQVVIMNDTLAAVPLGVSIAHQTKRVMLQAVWLGIALAIVGMLCAAFNLIPVVVGAFLQEAIDVVSIMWALTAMFDRTE